MSLAIAGIEADAVHDELRGVVEIAGQLMGAGGSLESVSIDVESSWGARCSLVSGRLGAFGVLLRSETDRRGAHVTVTCADASVCVPVR